MAKAAPAEQPTGLLLYKHFADLPSDWRPPKLGDLPDWPRGGRVGLDVETCDPKLKTLGPGVRREGSHLAGISFAIEGGPKHYLPIAHEGGDNLNPQHVLAYLEVQARQFDGEIVGANLGYDLDWLAQYKVDFLEGPCQLRDVQVAAPLIHELHRSYSLDNIAKRLGFVGKDEVLLKQAAKLFRFNEKAELWRLPARYVGPYATEDAALPLEILAKQEAEIAAQGIEGVWKIEREVQKVLIKMRRRGVLIDFDKLDWIEQWALKTELEALAEVKHLTGIELGLDNCWKAAAVAPILTGLGLKIGKTPTGKPKVDKEVLNGVDHPAGLALAKARKFNKLRSTFVKSIRTHQVNGRIHTTFNQLRNTSDFGDESGAAFGRLSSSLPNLQQQPASKEFKQIWRSIYLPEDGAVWGALDYSQQEPRWTIHYAEAMDLPKAAEAAQAYRDNPDTDNHQMMADMAGVTRDAAKAIFLGLVYGMGGAKLCGSLRLPIRYAVFYDGYGIEPEYFDKMYKAREHAVRTEGRAYAVAGEEGQELLNTFNHKLPFLKMLSKECQKVAESRGYIITAGGRHCRFPQTANGTYDWAYKSLNRLIQGTSADQTKKAMVEADRAGHWLQLQVHDELDGSFTGPGDARDCAEIMSNCMPANVPFKVDIDIGPTWGDAKEIEV